MRIQLKWFLTGKVTPLEERDDLLGPDTTMLEVKGLIQLKYTYPAKHMLLIAHKSLLENEETLKSIGVASQEDADRDENVITVHVLSGAELEGDDDDDEGEDQVNPVTGSSINEFTHDDFIKASKMLGRDLPVSAPRTAAVRAAPPRARPAFVDAIDQNQPDDSGPAAGSATESTASKVHTIFKNVWYGLRKENVEKEFGIAYPGVAETFDFWDLRLSHEGHKVDPGQICLELFFFGELEKIDAEKFHTMAVESMQRHGFRVQRVGAIREAGCMYPLLAVPVILSEAEAYQLGDAVFERFGRPVKAGDAPPQRAAPTDGPAGEKAECIVM